mmetsp:Transcript_54799/g.90348  ORF Transcript_54799/g.90348 Transcript_54799/m.90348 type:complete len:218 (+) Transcript_54799:956-1609(+)
MHEGTATGLRLHACHLHVDPLPIRAPWHTRPRVPCPPFARQSRAVVPVVADEILLAIWTRALATVDPSVGVPSVVVSSCTGHLHALPLHFLLPLTGPREAAFTRKTRAIANGPHFIRLPVGARAHAPEAVHVAGWLLAVVVPARHLHSAPFRSGLSLACAGNTALACNAHTIPSVSHVIHLPIGASARATPAPDVILCWRLTIPVPWIACDLLPGPL